MDWQEEKKSCKIFLIACLLITLFLVAFYYYCRLSLSCGFLIGSALGFLTFQVSDLFSYKIIKIKNKHSAAWAAFMTHLFNIVIIGVVLVIMLYINKYFHNDFYGDNKAINIAFYPFNVVAFIVGITMYRWIYSLILVKNEVKKKGGK